MHRLMIAIRRLAKFQQVSVMGINSPGPAPLEGLEIWVGGELYKLFHESVTVTNGTRKSDRIKMTASCVLTHL